MRVVREELLLVLEVVKYGLNKRETIEQSSKLVFQDGQVTAYNEDVYCTAPSPLGDLEGAVFATELLETLRDLKHDELEVSIKSGCLTFAAKREKFKIRLEEAVLQVDRNAKIPTEWSPLPEHFLEALSLAVRHAGTDAHYFASTCVHLHMRFIEACDGFQLLRFKVDTGLPEPVLVRGEAARSLPNLGMVEYALAPAWLFFRSPQKIVYGCRRHDVQYPDLSSHLKIGVAEELVLPKDLTEFVKRADRFSKAKIEDDMVRVDLTPGEIRVVGEGPVGSYSGRKKVRYEGGPVSFFIAPKVLTDLVKDHQECEISNDKIRIVGERWKYVVRLSHPSSNGNGKHEENDHGE